MPVDLTSEEYVTSPDAVILSKFDFDRQVNKVGFFFENGPDEFCDDIYEIRPNADYRAFIRIIANLNSMLTQYKLNRKRLNKKQVNIWLSER